MLGHNYTNFTSKEVAAKILTAMQECIDTGHAAFVLNRRKQRFMRVDIVRFVSGVYSFQFTGTTGQDLGSMILRAMFNWAPEDDRQFTKLTVALHERSEHPLITVARNAQKLQAALLMGCKETFTLLGNRKVVGVVKRNWMGRKVLWLFKEVSGMYTLIRQTPEVLASVTYREPLSV